MSASAVSSTCVVVMAAQTAPAPETHRDEFRSPGSSQLQNDPQGAQMTLVAASPRRLPVSHAFVVPVVREVEPPRAVASAGVW
jgi:hypothetical protein